MEDPSFEALFRAHYNKVLRFIERRIDQDDAPDLCARCFEIAHSKFDPTDPFGLPWLYQTARNLLGNAYRKRDRERELVARLGSLQPGDSAPAERELEIRVALAKLPPKDREAVQLTYWEGLTAAEVGAVLGCSEQAAWKRLSRAKAQLRTLMHDQRQWEEELDARR